ncbi:hypothetical protein [Hyphococcus sp.]|uniref:hypothetical protein n=1 Tax=Hyphococcus sp. TaxID=2038636 RepID=UPI0035C6F06D
MNKIVGALTVSLIMAAFASGCTTTESLTASERRAAVDEAVLEVDQDQVAVSDEDYDPNEMICKTRRASGSRLGKYRDCRTAREWRRSMSNAAMSATGIGNSGVARSSQ